MTGQCRFARLDIDGNILWVCQGLDNTPHKHYHAEVAVQKVRTTGKWLDRRKQEAGK